MYNQLFEAVSTALIKNLDYSLKTDLISSGMNAIELEKTSNQQEGNHLIIFNLDESPLEYIVALPHEDNLFDQEIRKMLIETNVNAEITKVLNSIQAN